MSTRRTKWMANVVQRPAFELQSFLKLSCSAQPTMCSLVSDWRSLRVFYK